MCNKPPTGSITIADPLVRDERGVPVRCCTVFPSARQHASSLQFTERGCFAEGNVSLGQRESSDTSCARQIASSSSGHACVLIGWACARISRRIHRAPLQRPFLQDSDVAQSVGPVPGPAPQLHPRAISSGRKNVVMRALDCAIHPLVANVWKVQLSIGYAVSASSGQALLRGDQGVLGSGPEIRGGSPEFRPNPASQDSEFYECRCHRHHLVPKFSSAASTSAD